MSAETDGNNLGPNDSNSLEKQGAIGLLQTDSALDEGNPLEASNDSDNDLPEECSAIEKPQTVIGPRNLVLAFGVVFLAILGITNVSPFIGHPPSQDLYSIVFDAGSTGSRVFIFHFKLSEKGLIGLRLEKEVYKDTKPGISSYARNAREAAESLKPLLVEAIESVPLNFQPYTLLTFKATAGLRLLPEAKAESILREVRKLLISSPFYLPDPDRIEVMNGEEEGLFGWISVNFLLGAIWDENSDNSVTTFDLGGGSTQISFEISKMEALANFLVKDLFKLRLLQSEFNVFTRSYLGYGLKSARLGIMGGTEGPDGSITYDLELSDQLDAEDVILLSSCYTVGINFTFTYSDVLYIVKGQNPNANVLPKCKAQVDHFVATGNFVQDTELSRREIHLFSYFFDVARWANLIPRNVQTNVLVPQDYFDAAKKYCHRDNFSRKRPFLCLDLLYIHSLLTTGVGLPSDKQLNVEKQLLGHEVSWCLGAALSTLYGKFSYSPLLL